MIKYLFAFALALCFSCDNVENIQQNKGTDSAAGILVVGIAQDAGYPQANCEKSCCKPAWENPSTRRMVSCLAIVDKEENKYWLVDATPDIKDQMQLVKDLTPENPSSLAGILLTHAHIGHYTGLMHLGREVMGAQGIPVYTMPLMHEFLRQNGPWSQLVSLKNIDLQPIKTDTVFQLSDRISFQALQVPHRDEFSETVGYLIKGKTQSILFIPDIDKWSKWNESIVDWIKKVDYAFLDGSFYKNGEIPGRDMSEIPHPFIKESMELFSELSNSEKQKVHFIHFNHTNPALRKNTTAHKEIIENKFKIAEQGNWINLK